MDQDQRLYCNVRVWMWAIGKCPLPLLRGASGAVSTLVVSTLLKFYRSRVSYT